MLYQMFEDTLLRDLLLALITNGMPIIFIFWLLERPFMKRWFSKIGPWVEREIGVSIKSFIRYLALVLSVAVSVPLYLVYATLGYATTPGSFEQWMNLILWLGSINFTGTQMLHTITHKRVFYPKGGRPELTVPAPSTDADAATISHQ